MELALNEVKIQAKKLLKHIQSVDVLTHKLTRYLKQQAVSSTTDVQLKHCLNIVALHFGFTNWHHCQTTLSGNSNIKAQPNLGTLLYNSSCGAFINEWFTTYQEAKAVLTQQYESSYLVPYKTQFIVVKNEYLKSLGVNEESLYLLNQAKHDLFQSYNTQEWDQLIVQVLKKNSIKQ